MKRHYRRRDKITRRECSSVCEQSREPDDSEVFRQQQFNSNARSIPAAPTPVKKNFRATRYELQ